MTALAYLRDHGLAAKALPDGKLEVAPASRITDDIRSWIRSHKADVLADLAREVANITTENATEFFAERAAIMQLDGDLTRAEAERQAASRVFEYKLVGWEQYAVLLVPGGGIEAARAWCAERFGERVINVRPFVPHGRK